MVTGSTGMLGGHLVAELLHRGYTDIILPVRSLARLKNLADILRREGQVQLAAQIETGTCKMMGCPLHPVQVRLNDPVGLRDAFKGVDTVFHCAAVVSLDSTDPCELIETNVEITTHVVDAAIECGVRRMVHTSSIAALGETLPGQTNPDGSRKYIDETTNLESLVGTSPYGVSKFLSENRVWRGATQGLEVVVVNPAIIIGAGDWKSGGSTLIIPFAASGEPFYTDGVMAYVDVRDVARAEVDLSVNKQAVGERFVLAAENLSYKDFITRVAKIAGRRPPFIRAGKALLGVAWRADLIRSKLSGKESRLTKAAAASAIRECYYDGGKIVRFVPGFKYTPIDQTLKRVVDVYKNRERDGY